MKIVHVCPQYTEGWGYQENVLPKYQKRLGFDVSIIASEFAFNNKKEIASYKKTNYFDKDGIWIIRLKTKGNKGYYYKFRDFIGFYETLEKEKPDILFVHGVQFVYIKTIVQYVKKHKRVRVYVDNHGDFSNSGTNWLSRNILHKIIWRYYAHMIAPYTRKFFGVLPARVDWLIDMYGLPRKKCDLLLMGADDDIVEKAKKTEIIRNTRKRNHINKDDFLIVSGGKIDLAKMQTLLLMEAVNQIKDDKLKLIVFGPVVEELQEKMNALCSKRVIHIPWLTAEESYQYFAASNLVVFPGRHSVYWEQAVGVGVPVMVKYWKGTTHVDVGGNCIFLKKDTVEEIKGKIEKLLKNPNLYKRMQKAAEEKGMQEFSYLNIAKKSIEYKKNR